MVELAGSYRLDSMNHAGIVVADAFRSSAVVRPDGLSRVWGTHSPHDYRLSCSVTERGRVALLDVHPTKQGRWPADLRLVRLESDDERVVDPKITKGLSFDSGTEGIVAWAGEEKIWIGASDDRNETGLWIGRLDLATGLVCGSSFEDPYAESGFSMSRPPTAERCSFNVHAGQHGGWAFEANIVGGTLSIRPLVPSNGVHSYFRAENDDILGIDQSTLVRWAADGAVRGKLELGGDGYPTSVMPAPDGRALVQFENELAAVVDAQSMRLVGPVSFGETYGCGAHSMSTVGGPYLFATSFRVDRNESEHTTIAFWTL